MADLDPALTRWGWDAGWQAKADRTGGPDAPARVVRHDGVAVLAATATGPVHLALRRSGVPVTVGDWVLTDGEVVTGVLERVALLRRRDPDDEHEQLLAANAEVVAVVAGLDRPVRPGRLQRAVTLAHDSGAEPVVVLNKADVVDDAGASAAGATDEAARAVPGVDVLTVAALPGEGVDVLAAVLGPRTVVLLGESGAGKSTLANALCGDEVAATGAVRSGDHKGRHTTTTRQLHPMAAGGWLIDSPGLRAVGLWTDEATVDDAFADVEAVAGSCRFRDCAHDAEPGCAVKEAVAGGTLDADRLEAWHRLRREAASAAERADEAAARAAGRRFSRMAREAQRLKRR